MFRVLNGSFSGLTSVKCCTGINYTPTWILYSQSRCASDSYFSKIRKISQKSGVQNILSKASKLGQGIPYVDQIKAAVSGPLASDSLRQLTNKSSDSLKDLKHSPTPAIRMSALITLPLILPPLLDFSVGAFYPTLTTIQVAYAACVIPYLIGVKSNHQNLFTAKKSSIVTESTGIQLETAAQFTSKDNMIDEISVSTEQFVKTGLPVALGFSSLLCLQMPPVSLFLVGSGFAASMYADLLESPFSGWYMSMRLLLSAIAVLSLGGTFICYWVLPQRKQKKVKTSTAN